jgi:hypothetical protein
MGSKHRNAPTEQREDGAIAGDRPDLLDPVSYVEPTVGKVPVLLGMLSDYKALPILPTSPPVCTWSLAETKGRARLHQCINGAGPSLWDMCEKGPYQFLVEHLAANFTSWEPEDRPGELVEGPMFYLIGPNEILHSGSDGVYLSLQQLAMLEGAPPWNPPVVMRAERAPTRNRRMRLALSFIGRG